MNVQIHLDNSFDKEKLIELQSNSLRLLSTDHEPKAIEYLIESQAKGRLKYKSEIVAVALDKDELVGFACLSTNAFLITGLYVHPNFIRKGIGMNLLNFINKIAQESGCKVIRVYSSLAAVDFYKAQGFEVINYSKFSTEYYIPYVHLKKKLVYEPNLNSKTFSTVHLVVAIILLCSLIGPILKILHNPASTIPTQTLREKLLKKE